MMHSPVNAMNIHYIDETHSTNSYLAELCLNGDVPELTTVCTGFQTAGRGQRGNSWESAKDANLLFSFVLYPTFIAARHQFILSQMVSLAIVEVLSTFADGFSIKWPNDIYWKEKKIAGILIENDLTGLMLSKSIAGIGLNINQESFKSDAPNPVSLYQILGTKQNKEEILQKIMERMAFHYQAIRRNDTDFIRKTYMQYLFRREGMHQFSDKDETFMASILRIEESGRLVLLDTSKQERGYYFKEVSFVF